MSRRLWLVQFLDWHMLVCKCLLSSANPTIIKP